MRQRKETTPDTPTKSEVQEVKKKSDGRGKSGKGICCELFFGLILGTIMFGVLGYAIQGSFTWHLEKVFQPKLASMLGTATQIRNQMKPKYFTPEELKRYDGSNPDLPIYLAVKGRVYDVTAGRSYYGPGGGYHGFAGRDASRAFLNLCFTEECLAVAHDLSGLSAEQLKGIDDWADFYEKDPKYPFVGFVKRPPKQKESSQTSQ